MDYKELAELTLKDVDETIDMLGGANGVKRFLKGLLVLKETYKIDTWMNIELGNFSDPQAVIHALNTNGFFTNSASDFVIKKIDFGTKRKVDLTKITGADLGLCEEYGLDELYKTAEKFGLEPCPAEVGPTLRLKCHYKESILIAMKPIIGNENLPAIFSLEYHEFRDPALYIFHVYDSIKFTPDNTWVFTRKKETK